MAKRQAQREGLKLARCGNTCGYVGVRFKEGECNPYKAWHREEGGRIHHLGYFATKEEAALAVARKVAGVSGEVHGHAPAANAAYCNGEGALPSLCAEGVLPSLSAGWQAAAEAAAQIAPQPPPPPPRTEGAIMPTAPAVSEAAAKSRKKRSAQAALSPAVEHVTPPSAASTHPALEAVRELKRSDRSLTAKQVHALLPEKGFAGLALAAVKRLCSEAIRE